MAEITKDIHLLSEQPSEMTLVPDIKDSPGNEVPSGLESDRKLGVQDKTSELTSLVGSKSEDLGLVQTTKGGRSISLPSGESSTLEEALGGGPDDKDSNTGMDDGEREITEPASYPSGLRFGLLTAAVCMTIGTVALDSTIVSTAIPTLVDRWDSLADMGWYGSAFLLPQPVLQPSFGKAYPFGNTKYMFIFGLVIFEVGSLICSLANSSIMFILGRTVAGIGGAALAPGVMLILTDVVPREKRPLYTGLLAASGGTCACLGPIIGGIFTTKLTWRWCFWINLPMGCMVGVAVFLLYTPLKRSKKGISAKEIFLMMDPIGCLLVTGSALSLLLALTFAAETSWSETKVVVLLVLFAVLLVLLAIQQKYVNPKHALLPRRILKNRGILLCALFGFLVEVGSTGHVYYLPFYFQGSKGASAETSGVHLLPYLLSQTLAAIVAGVIINRTGFFNPPMLGGTVMFSIGAGFLTTLTATTNSAHWIGFQVLAGFGTGCAQFMAMGIAQQLLVKEDESIGLALVYMIKTLGGSVAVSICSTIFYSDLRSQLASDGLTLQQISTVLLSISSLGAGISGSMKELAAVAVANAVDKVFYVPLASGIAAWLVAMVTEWRKIQKAPEPEILQTTKEN